MNAKKINSSYHRGKSIDNNKWVAGACGEIAADLGSRNMDVLTNVLAVAQNLEYKMPNV